MLQTLLGALLSAGMMVSVVVMNEVASPRHAFDRLTPVVVGILDLDTAPATTTFAVSNMAPGDTVVRSLTVANGGTLPFRYAMRAVVDEDASGLASQLRIAVHEADGGDCKRARGAALVARSRPADVAFGSPAWVAQHGERRLDAGASAVLCFFVELSLSATNVVSASSTVLTFTFDAEEIRAE